MKKETRERKGKSMLNAAVQVMQRKGLSNFTMEEVALEANVTKVTLYTYFASKENLTMAICHSIYTQIQALADQATIECTDESGLETCMEIKAKVLAYLAEQPFRSTMIMETISVYNMPIEKLSSAMAASSFRILLNEKLKNLAQVIITALEKGRKDGSIGNEAPNEILIAYLWNCLSGFITIISIPGFQHDNAKGFLDQMNAFHEKFARDLLASK